MASPSTFHLTLSEAEWFLFGSHTRHEGHREYPKLSAEDAELVSGSVLGAAGVLWRTQRLPYGITGNPSLVATQHSTAFFGLPDFSAISSTLKNSGGNTGDGTSSSRTDRQKDLESQPATHAR